MAFQEKSAWIMAVALLITSLFYGMTVVSMSGPDLAPPVLPVLVVYTVAQTVLAIVGHVLIALLSPKEANAAVDERGRRISDRAGHWSGYVLGAGVVTALIGYLFSYDGDLMFYLVFASLILSQLVEYGIQIWFYRRGIV